jgi:uncharacterized protein (TIGR00266 family)
MQHEIEYGPSFAWLRVQLAPSEAISAEAGSMVTRSPALHMETRLNAGPSPGVWNRFVALLTAIVRRVLGKETLFINRFSGPQGGEVVLAPSMAGHIVHYPLAQGQGLLIQAGAYLASNNVELKMRWGGLRTLFGGEGLFLLEAAGPGELFVNAYGGIREVDVHGTYIVDTGHIVAFDRTLDFKIRGAGKGLKALFLSGEGLVCEFTGSGRLYLQSRNVGALVGWLSSLLRS